MRSNRGQFARGFDQCCRASGHHRASTHANKRCNQPKSDTPCKNTIIRGLKGQKDNGQHVHQRKQKARSPHDAKYCGIERCAYVVVAGNAAYHLHCNQQRFDDQHRASDVDRNLYPTPSPLSLDLNISQQLAKCKAINRTRKGKLNRLYPCVHAGDYFRIYYHTQE